MDKLLEIMDAQLAGGREEVDMGEERENRGDLPEAMEDVEEDQQREERRGVNTSTVLLVVAELLAVAALLVVAELLAVVALLATVEPKRGSHGFARST